jgi:hypothetical protein
MAVSRSNVAHVKGHQDDHHAYEDLSLEARLNVDADSSLYRNTIYIKQLGRKVMFRIEY